MDTQASRHTTHTVAPAAAAWYPQEHRIEWLADIVVHAIGIALALVGCVLLVSTAFATGSPRLTAALVVYSAGLLVMLGASFLCNANTKQHLRAIYERFDLSGIFIMIAGSYTPFMLGRLEGVIAYSVLALVWVAALAGVALNLLARWDAPRVYLALYLVLGWAAVTVIDRLIATLSPLGLGLLAAGGALYTIGVVFHVNKKLPFNSAIWHGFVVAAATCHFLAIYLDVAAVGASAA